MVIHAGDLPFVRSPSRRATSLARGAKVQRAKPRESTCPLLSAPSGWPRDHAPVSAKLCKTRDKLGQEGHSRRMQPLPRTLHPLTPFLWQRASVPGQAGGPLSQPRRLRRDLEPKPRKGRGMRLAPVDSHTEENRTT